MNKYNLKFWLMLAIGMFSCGKKRDHDDEAKTAAYYSLGINTGGVSYSLPADNLEAGTIQAEGNGTRLEATSLITSGKYIYFFSRSKKTFYQYELNTDGTITQTAALAVGNYVSDWAYSQNLVDENTILVMDPVKWGEPEIKWFTIRIPNFTISGSGSFNLPSKERSPGVNWKSNVGSGRLHGDKFIMGTVYYDFAGHFAAGSHVVTFDFPGMKNPTLVSTNLTSAELGIYATNGFVTAENGDLYIAACRGALWGSRTDGHIYGGILRIKKGETQFDESYFFDLAKTTGSPVNILQLDYLGGTSAMAILFDDTRIKGWGDVANDHYFFAKVDLQAQRVTRYNIPNSDAHSAKRPLIEHGKYITFLKSAAYKTTNLLEIDLKGGPDAYKKGALITGKNVKGYSVVKHPAAD
ncbi:DUF4374 domain-containing protein [Dyadobacter pollutisoli]|uniref:DUF4374 domain-containing protein n=1 Tax=Dyadobacter pollutisoli TaxID=2910158 RepID=A0A9E8NF89_9BACT|nr:DUF4374 domain-containing protein [Dyadobacter pollutisoli]WAC13044.1 DUF4374 domain-containing protein [Dyadobacter pollutisoli]